MNNQAAQTMPLPEPIIYSLSGTLVGYTADQMHQYARDYAAALSQPAGVPTPWTTEQCLEFASVAFRHAPSNLPKGVTLQDIRLGAIRALRAAAPAASGGEDELLEWISHNLLGDHRDYAMHVLKRGGTGDAGDLRSFVESIRGSAR